MKDLLQKQVQEDWEYVRDLRRYFHQYPEVACQEWNTAKKIEEELHKIGLSSKRVGETGVFAEIRGNLPGDKCIVLRADIDALPMQEDHQCSYKSKYDGVMHSCGHDAHTASLLGAARILVKNKDAFGGSIRLIFQQAEEIGYGAKVFIKEGCLVGADRTFGLHLASKLNVGKVAFMAGPNNASVDWFKINVKGKSAHVSTPQLGVDAVYIASQIVVAAQALVSRRNSPVDPLILGIGKLTAGTSYNIVAGQAELEGTIRALTPFVRKKIKEELEILASSIAVSYGGFVSFQWKDYTSPLINDEIATKEAQKVAEKLFGAENVIRELTPSLGGDDFAEFILEVPGVYGFVGSGNPEIPETVVAHHNSYFDIDESSLIQSTLLYTVYALDYLNESI